MEWIDVVELGNTEETIVHGEPISSIVYREVFANKKSVRQSEFYQASSVGLKPELVFEIHSDEFTNDEKVRYPVGENGKVYSIIRAYKKDDTTELTVTSHVGSEV